MVVKSHTGMPRHYSRRMGRRRGNIPRSTVRSVKYIVNQAGASSGAGLEAVTMIQGVDNATLGQTGATDVAVPTGAKISKIEIFMPKVNLGENTANFVTWSIQHTRTGQAVVSPILQGGNPLRSNVMLTGVIGLGQGQNSGLHIKYDIPASLQRVRDGDLWVIVNNNGLAVSTQYMFIYKVFM